MLFAKLPLYALLCAGMLAGCSNMGSEAYQRTYARDTYQLTHTNYWELLRKSTGFDKLIPGQKDREDAAELVVCTHPNGQNRVISQNGVSDYASYRRCAATPYPAAGSVGQRLSDRPKG